MYRWDCYSYRTGGCYFSSPRHAGMRCSADWMALADERILEYLCENGPAEPAEIARHECVHFGRQYIGRRLRDQLEPRGMVSKAGRGTYFITDDGRAYLRGDLDASELVAGE